MASQNVNVALIKGALNHADIKTTLRHYAKTNKQAELEARELVRDAWLKAAEQVPEVENISAIKKVPAHSR